MSTPSGIPLTDRLHVERGAHILYLFNDEATYLANVVAFIETGAALGHHILYVDSEARWTVVQARVRERRPDALTCVKYVPHRAFSGPNATFRAGCLLRELGRHLDPFVAQGTTMRLWSRLDVPDSAAFSDRLADFPRQHESACDRTVSDVHSLAVCAYPARVLTSALALDLLRVHSYLMTDAELVRSPLSRSSQTNTDIPLPTLTEQVRMESEVHVYRQKLDFVQVVSHEVRNPLTIIRAYASLLRDQEPDPDKRAKLQSIIDYAVVIDHEISHILATEEMLAADALWSKRVLTLRPILDEVLDVMATKARTQNIRLVCEVDVPKSTTCLGNRMGLKLIFSNILSNAIKYSQEGSTVQVWCRVNGAVFEFVVRDYGIGMTDEQLQRLFRKYEKQNEDTSGQGIGLYMVKMLVDRMNGEIHIDSRQGRGTQVTVRLPLQ